jgi:hypothetical protein
MQNKVLDKLFIFSPGARYGSLRSSLCLRLSLQLGLDRMW